MYNKLLSTMIVICTYNHCIDISHNQEVCLECLNTLLKMYSMTFEKNVIFIFKFVTLKFHQNV